MNGYCLNDKYCQYKTDSGYCGCTAGCVLDNSSVMIEAPNTPSWSMTKVVDISTDSIEAIADAVAKKLRGEIGGIVRCKDCKSFRKDESTTYCAPMGLEMQPDDYCSYAERKEE